MRNKAKQVCKIGWGCLKARLLNKKVPLAVSWEVTTQCNYSCAYCSQWKNPSTGLTTEQLVCIAGQIAEAGVRKVQFTGGEPLLHPGLSRVIDVLAERDVNISIISNGSLVKGATDIIKKINVLCLSLDGPERIHDSIRGKGAFRSLIEAAESAKKYNIGVRFHTVISTENAGSMSSILKMAQELKVKVYFQPARICSLGGGDLNPLSLPAGFYKTVMEGLIEEKRRNPYIGNSKGALRHLADWPEESSLRCFITRVSCRITYSGGMCVCPNAPEDTGAFNCLDMGFAESYRALHPVAECAQCWVASRVEANLAFSLNFSSMWEMLKTC